MRRRVREHEEVGELNIVPYLDIIMNLVMFMLLSMTGLITFGVVNVAAPKIGGDPTLGAAATDKPKLTLTVAISKKGFYIAGAGGVVGAAKEAGVDTTGAPTIPSRGPEYDYPELTKQMIAVKLKYPTETGIIFLADPEIPYETLIKTMDACREAPVKMPDGTTEHRNLFFDVSLSVI
jgi:biopolymer transport protein ExbD